MQATTARCFVLSIAAHAVLLSPIFYFATPSRTQPDPSPMVLTLLDAPAAVAQRHSAPLPHAVDPTPQALSMRPPYSASAPAAVDAAQEVKMENDAPASSVNAEAGRGGGSEEARGVGCMACGGGAMCGCATAAGASSRVNTIGDGSDCARGGVVK